MMVDQICLVDIMEPRRSYLKKLEERLSTHLVLHMVPNWSMSIAVKQVIYIFFLGSTKCGKVLSDLLKDVDNTLQLCNLSKTCWTAHLKSVEAIWQSFETIMEVLKQIHGKNDVDGDTKTKAYGVLTCTLRFNFTVSLMFAENVFIKTKMMTKVLEKDTLDITGKCIQKIQESEGQLNNLVDASLSFSSKF